MTLTHAFILLAGQMAFYALCAAAYYYGWADDELPRTKPQSPQRLVGVKIMGCVMVASAALTLAVIL